jgi:DNA invertase Pin-like site-specific DNA recombinase
MTHQYQTPTCVYLRCSTSSQETENQLLEIQSYTERHNYRITRIFRDEGVSGSSFNREGLSELLKEVQQGKHKLILVYSLCRLGRRVKECCEILDLCQKMGTNLIFVKDGISTDSLSGRLVFQIMASVYELEKSILVERIKSGINRARKENKTLGRPRVLTPQLRNAIVELRGKNLGIRKIGKICGVSTGVVYQALEVH